MRFIRCFILLFFLLNISIAGTDTIAVTGKPADRAFIDELINERYGISSEPMQDLYEGQSIEYELNSANILTIHNLYHPEVRASSLLVSNEPEELYSQGIIFEKKIAPQQKIRIVYYHLNRSAKVLFLNLLAVNEHYRTSSFHIIPGIGGPSRDTVYTGHVATKRFLENLTAGQGYFVSVAAGTNGLITSQKIKMGQVASGVLEVTNMSEKEQKLVLFASDHPFLRPKQAIHQPRIRNQISGLFPDPYLDLDIEIKLDGQMKYFRLGDSPFLVDIITGRSLKGNYGLLYRYRIRLINSYNSSKKVALYCSAHGGPARGVFVVNGQIIETGLLSPLSGKNITKITEHEIYSNSSKDIEIVTMPQPGSNYPVSLIIKEVANDD